MPSGLQLFREDGTKDIDSSLGLPRYLGTTPPVWSGSVQVPEWGNAKPWFVILSDQIGGPHQINATTASSSGTTLSWSTPAQPNRQPSVVVYGCY